ncbi:MAG: hypothetical protein ACR2N4_10380 [Jatrophihabitans sp.]
MSNYTKFNAAVDIAAAYNAVLSAGVSVIETAPAQRTRMTSTGLTNAVFGKGHPPRGIPLC